MTAELLKNYGSSCNVFSHKNIITSGFKAVLCFTLQGASPTTIILVVPLFFGVCHLHHARELLLVHRQPLEHVLAMVGVEQQHSYAELHHTLTTATSLVLTGPAADGVVLERGCNSYDRDIAYLTDHTGVLPAALHHRFWLVRNMDIPEVWELHTSSRGARFLQLDGGASLPRDGG